MLKIFVRSLKKTFLNFFTTEKLQEYKEFVLCCLICIALILFLCFLSSPFLLAWYFFPTSALAFCLIIPFNVLWVLFWIEFASVFSKETDKDKNLSS